MTTSSEGTTGRTPVLFVGLGAMGTPMATSLARSGHPLLLCDVDDARAGALAEELGACAVAAGAIAAAAGEAHTVVLMLPDSAAVEQVLTGDSGLLGHLPPGTTVVDMSSSRPSSTVALAARARAGERRGLRRRPCVRWRRAGAGRHAGDHGRWPRGPGLPSRGWAARAPDTR